MGVLGVAGTHVHLGDLRGERPQPIALRGHGGAQLAEPLGLELLEALVGGQDLRLQGLELRGRVALAAGDRLLADELGRDVLQVRLRDLEVVPEDLVEPELEGRDARALLLAGLELEEPVLAGARELRELVDPGVEARPEDPAVAAGVGRRVAQRARQAVVELGHEVERRGLARRQLGERIGERGQDAERVPERSEVARRGDPERGARGQPLDVRDLPEHLAHAPPHLGPLHEDGDPVLAAPDRLHVTQGIEQLRADEPRAGGGLGGVDAVDQRALPLAGHRPQELEVPLRGLVRTEFSHRFGLERPGLGRSRRCRQGLRLRVRPQKRMAMHALQPFLPVDPDAHGLDRDFLAATQTVR